MLACLRKFRNLEIDYTALTVSAKNFVQKIDDFFAEFVMLFRVRENIERITKLLKNKTLVFALRAFLCDNCQIGV